MKDEKTRFFYLDNLKVFLIILVIIHHVGQPYGPTGGFWPYHSSLHENIPWLSRFYGVNASFFMGLFFMISGYFFPMSFDRHGVRKFLQDKLRRFGIPLAFGFLIMIPAVDYFYYIHYSGNQPLGYVKYFTNIFLGIGGKPEGYIYIQPGWFPEWNLGPLWFIEHLLIYSILYALYRILFKNIQVQGETKSPGLLFVMSMGLLIGIGSSILSRWYPQDKWVKLFGFIQAEVEHLSQYVVMFIIGVMAGRYQWFQRIDKKTGFICLTLGLVMAGIVFLRPFPLPMMKSMDSHWQFYEGFMGMFIAWGLIVLFREVFNHAGLLMQWLAKSSYAAYIFHYPIVIAIQKMFDTVIIDGALGKFVTVSLLSIVATYLISGLIRPIPYIRRVL